MYLKKKVDISVVVSFSKRMKITMNDHKIAFYLYHFDFSTRKGKLAFYYNVTFVFLMLKI